MDRLQGEKSSKNFISEASPLLPPYPRAEAGERRRVSCPFSKAVLVLGQGIRQYEEDTGEEE